MADISTVIDGLAAAPDPVLPDLLREHAPPLLSSNGGLLRPLVPRLRALDGHGDPCASSWSPLPRRSCRATGWPNIVPV